jgi:integrase
VQHNVAAVVRKPSSGCVRREGQVLSLEELRALTEACKGRYRDVVPVLALAGLRWGELGGLQVGDRVLVPGPGLRLRRAVLASGGGGLYVDTLKNNRTRTVPLVLDLVPIVDRWGTGRRRMRGCSTRLKAPSAGVELETLGGLEHGHVGGRCPRLLGS